MTPRNLAWALLGKYENIKVILYSDCDTIKDKFNISSQMPSTTKDTHSYKGFPACWQTHLTM